MEGCHSSARIDGCSRSHNSSAAAAQPSMQAGLSASNGGSPARGGEKKNPCDVATHRRSTRGLSHPPPFHGCRGSVEGTGDPWCRSADSSATPETGSGSRLRSDPRRKFTDLLSSADS